MVLRLVTLAAAQVLDLWTFGLMVGRHGIAAEANPLAAQLFVAMGLPVLVAGKVALVVAIGALAVAGAAVLRRPLAGTGSVRAWAAVRGVPLALAVAAGLIGGITNAGVILT